MESVSKLQKQKKKKKKMIEYTVGGSAVLASVAVAVLASRRLRGVFSSNDTPRASFEPNSAAFAIWFVIFAGSLAFGAALVAQHDADGDTRARMGIAAGAHACAYLLCALWTVLFQSRRYELSAAALAAAFAMASAASAVVPHRATAWAYCVPLDVLCGWLLVAAALAVATAVPTADDPGLLVVLAIASSAPVILARRPFLLAPLAWACLLQKKPSVAGSFALVWSLIAVVLSAVPPP